MTRMKNRNDRRGGFTLLEVMAAMTVFLVGVIAVIGLLTSGTRLHQESQTLVFMNDVVDEVLLLSRREIAEKAARSGDALPEPSPPVPVPSRPELKYAWKLVASPDSSLFLMQVDLLWMENGQNRKATFERVLPRLSSAAVDVRTTLVGRQN